jgi:cyclic lactone autoinducer peptide
VTKEKGGIYMKKVVKKLVEMYAKSSTNSCYFWVFHAPKAPKCLIRK